MKKFILLISLVVTSNLCTTQVLNEKFESVLGLPTGWTNNDIAGNGEVWTFDDTGDAPYFESGNALLTAYGFVGNYALFNSFGYGNNGNAENAALESPSFSCVGLTSIVLEFIHYFTAGGTGACFVEVYDGTQWLQVASYGSTPVAGHVSIDVTSELTGVSNAQVRFRWTGDYDFSWVVDNISVYDCATTLADPVTVSNPLNMATNVPIILDTDFNGDGTVNTSDAAVTFTWDNTTTGITPSGYVFVLSQQNPPPPNSFSFPMGAFPYLTLYGLNYGTTYYWSISPINCAGTTDAIEIWSFTTEACTETSAPASVNPIGPSDATTEVDLDETQNNSVPLSWEEGIGGGTAVSHTLKFGLSNPPDQVYTGWTNGQSIENLNYNTTYYWSIEAVNCTGTTSSEVWSFTTESDPVLSVDDHTLSENFDVYPNPVNNILHIKTTSNARIDKVTVNSIQGRQVLVFDTQNIINNSINLEQLPTGLYVITIESNDQKQSLKVLKH